MGEEGHEGQQGLREEIVIEGRYNGPEHSANGGYACACMAEPLYELGHACVRVDLRAPPPLDRPLDRFLDPAGRVSLTDSEQGVLVAEAEPADLELELPSAPTLALATEQSRHYTGFEEHALPHCFVCGPNRAPSEGLRIFPGRSPDAKHGPPGAVTGPWHPNPSHGDDVGRVSRRLVWAALDCPGYFAVTRPGQFALLASMTARVNAVPEVGEACVVLAWPLKVEGRKLRAATAVFGRGGRLLGCSRQLWITPAGAVS
jgi:hypothetical protein